MEDLMNYYIRLVPFLGEALGKSFEVAVLDCRTESIVAITNNHISGRSVGAPMTDFAKKMVSSGEWRNRDYIASYSGHTGNNKLLRSSTYFIKSGDTLLGMLCINMDTTDYQLISNLAHMLGGLETGKAKVANSDNSDSETFPDSVSNTIAETLHGLYEEEIPKEFSRNDRITILSRLQEKKVFLVKGSVPRIARILGCSIPTVYRELSHLKNQPEDSETS